MEEPGSPVEKRRGGLEDLSSVLLEEKLPLSTQKALFNQKALSQTEVHLEKVKHESTGRIFECVWMNETKWLCLRNGFANFTVIMGEKKKKKAALNFQQHLFARSGWELV